MLDTDELAFPGGGKRNFYEDGKVAHATPMARRHQLLDGLRGVGRRSWGLRGARGARGRLGGRRLLLGHRGGQG